MNVNVSSEFMKNQMHAVVMAADEQFEVLQTTEGDSLFFSIGTDNVFYCTREISANTQGWTKMDLSSALSSNYSNAAVAAKMFDVSQNLSAGTIDAALVIMVNGDDYLYLSLGNADTDAAWGSAITWTAIPYDDTSQSFTGLSINDVYLTESGGTEYIVVDIIANATTKDIFRYYIDPTKKLTGKFWNPHDLSGNLQAGTIINGLGRKPGVPVDGMYTMGTIVSEQELIYTPLYNPFNLSVAASPTQLKLPSGNTPVTTTAMALSVNAQGYTDLFFAANGSLYFLAAADQTSTGEPTLVYTHTLLTGVESLHVNNSSNFTVVWGMNQQGQLFYLKTTPGSEGSTTSWSYPIPLVTGIVNVATFLNNNANNLVIFAHLQDGSLLQLSQDPVTTAWQERNIVLPPTSNHDMVEIYTYSTRIQFTSEGTIPLPNTPATITATSPCSVYINNCYYVLSTTSPLQVTTDALGLINIIQQVNSIATVCYTVQSGGQSVSINPMTEVINRLNNTNIDVNVTDEKGNSAPLVGTNISAGQKTQVSQNISALVTASASMPQNGTLLNSNISNLVDAAMNRTSSLSPSNGNGTAYPDTGNAIDVLAGDLWQWMKSAATDVELAWMQVIDDVTHFFIQLGNEIYHVVLNCMADVAHGIDFVMRQIEVGIDDMVKWIGFIFCWSDIVRTHQVLRKVFLTYATQCVNDIDTFITDVANAFKNIETDINNWAGLPSPTTTYSSMSAPVSASSASNAPQTHWGIYHTQNNVGNASSKYNPGSTPISQSTQDILTTLLDGIKGELSNLETTCTQIQQLIEDLPSLTVAEVIQKIIAIILDAFLSTAQTFITTLLGVLADLVVGFIDALSATIDIPVISPMYKRFAGDDLSLLDLACLVISIPVTIVYKIFYEAVPFEDNAVTTSLINATDFTTIAGICNGTPPSTAAIPAQKDSDIAPLDNLMDIMVFSGNMAAFAGGMAQGVMNMARVIYPNNPWVAAAAAVFYLPYVAPDIIGTIKAPTKWYNILNSYCSVMGILKSGVDIVACTKLPVEGAAWTVVSPWADLAINVVWQVPTTGALADSDNENLGGLLNFIGGTFFDISGAASPVIASAVPIYSQAGTLIAGGSNLIYAAMSFAQTMLPGTSKSNSNNGANGGSGSNTLLAVHTDEPGAYAVK